MTRFFLSLIFLFLFVANINSQIVKETSIMLKGNFYINENIFSNPQSGIKELANQEKNLAAEFTKDFEELNLLSVEIENLNKQLSEIAKSVVGCSDIDGLVNNREKTLREFERKAQNGKKRYDKKYLEIVQPIFEKIYLVLKDFEKEKRYKITMINLSPELVRLDKNLDRTAEFIEFYNKRAL